MYSSISLDDYYENYLLYIYVNHYAFLPMWYMGRWFLFRSMKFIVPSRIYFIIYAGTSCFMESMKDVSAYPPSEAF
jgi:hypothetical protein